MENSNILATWLNFDYSKINYQQTIKYNNISQLGINNYNYGDIIALFDYRGTATHIIGKDGQLVKNPDYSDAGFLTIPYEITQYLDNATEKYKNIHYRDIDLKYNDIFIINNIGKIPKSWNFKFLYTDDNELIINFPNNTNNIFALEGLTSYKIKKFYDESFEEQTTIRLKIEIKEHIENYPNIPFSWFIEHGSSTYRNKLYKKEIIFKGPVKYKKKVIKNIKNFYKNVNLTII